jgi:hypothetical protein
MEYLDTAPFDSAFFGVAVPRGVVTPFAATMRGAGSAATADQVR